jgi:hypothetical protein
MLSRRTFVDGALSALVMTAASPAAAVDGSQRALPRELLRRAHIALETNRRHLRYTDVFAVADFSQPSCNERLYLVDAENGRAVSFYVCHGRGSDPGHRGFLETFSNEPGSAASSSGAFVTGAYYNGRYGRSMRLKGLDASNSNAAARGIVVHSAPYAEPEMISRMGKLGRSEGCFALPEASLNEVLERLGTGRLLYSDKL